MSFETVTAQIQTAPKNKFVWDVKSPGTLHKTVLEDRMTWKKQIVKKMTHFRKIAWKNEHQ